MKETQRQKQKSQTRKQIIEAALKQYAKTGLIKTPTIEIAKSAKVSHGTIFAHFPTQDVLLTEVIEEFGFRVNKRLHELVEGKSTVEEILKAHLEGLTEYEDFYIRLVSESRLLPPQAQDTVIMIQSAISHHLSRAAEIEMSEGKLKKLPLHMVFNGWIGLIHYYLTNHDLFSPGESVLKRYGQELTAYYMALLQVRI
ncbi:MAG: TetR/AcrR family transcriptional regulator [Bacillota bacterium]|nr:TetR/AcrR family transcriptional regulator [Bacillota bacterium]